MKIVRKEIKELLPLASIVTVIGVIALTIITYYSTQHSFLQYPIEGWIYATQGLDFIYPLIITVPFVGLLYMKRKNRFIEYVGVRINKEEYIKGQINAGAIVSFVVTYIIYFIPLLLSIYWIYYTRSYYAKDTGLENELFGNMMVNHPIIFGLLWCAWKGFLSSLLVRFGYKLALYVDNLFIILLGPFLYFFTENFVTAYMGMPGISFTTAFVIDRLSNMTVLTYVYGVITFLVVTTIIIKILKMRKEKLY